MKTLQHAHQRKSQRLHSMERTKEETWNADKGRSILICEGQKTPVPYLKAYDRNRLAKSPNVSFACQLPFLMFLFIVCVCLGSEDNVCGWLFTSIMHTKPPTSGFTTSAFTHGAIT